MAKFTFSVRKIGYSILASLLLLLSPSCEKDNLTERAAYLERVLPGKWSVSIHAFQESCYSVNEELPLRAVGVLTFPSFVFEETTLNCEVCTPLFLDLDMREDKFGLHVGYLLAYNKPGYFIALSESSYPEEPLNTKNYELFSHSTLFGRGYRMNFVNDNTIELIRNDIIYMVLNRI